MMVDFTVSYVKFKVRKDSIECITISDDISGSDVDDMSFFLFYHIWTNHTTHVK